MWHSGDVGVPNYVDNNVLEKTVRGVFKKIRANIDERDGQVCLRLKKKERTIVKFVDRKNCLQILREKKELKSSDPTELDFPENRKIFNESLFVYYRGIWNKCTKLRAIQKKHQFYTIKWFDSCEIGGNWSFQNNDSHGWFEIPISWYKYWSFMEFLVNDFKLMMLKLISLIPVVNRLADFYMDYGDYGLMGTLVWNLVNVALHYMHVLF